MVQLAVESVCTRNNPTSLKSGSEITWPCVHFVWSDTQMDVSCSLHIVSNLIIFVFILAKRLGGVLGECWKKWFRVHSVLDTHKVFCDRFYPITQRIVVLAILYYYKTYYIMFSYCQCEVLCSYDIKAIDSMMISWSHWGFSTMKSN